MAKTHVALIDEVEQELQDTGNAIWTAAELAIVMDKALKGLSEYQPYVMRETFQIESRTGSATSTTASALVDSTESQFLSTDVDKVIYNKTDNTWAIVTAFVSTSQLTLSKDIMVSGEDYEMFNEGCKSNLQVNIGDVPDYQEILKVVYKAQQDPEEKRNWTLEGDILTIDYDLEPDDSKVATSGDQPDVEVYVYFAKRHRVCRQTDLAGAVDLVAGYAAGSTSMVIDELTNADAYVYEGTLFTVAGIRGTYCVTADAAIATLEATVSFWPGLESAAVENDVVTFIGSTLTPRLERILVELTAARAVISKGTDYIGEVTAGGISIWKDFQEAGERRLGLILPELRRMTPPKTKHTWPKE